MSLRTLRFVRDYGLNDYTPHFYPKGMEIKVTEAVQIHAISIRAAVLVDEPPAVETNGSQKLQKRGK